MWLTNFIGVGVILVMLESKLVKKSPYSDLNINFRDYVNRSKFCLSRNSKIFSYDSNSHTPTRVSVDRMFSALKLIKSYLKASMKQDQAEAILFLSLGM